jgi:hypothetical protein
VVILQSASAAVNKQIKAATIHGWSRTASGSRLHLAEPSFSTAVILKMTPIPAKVLNVHKLYNEYLVTVQVGRDNFAGKFLPVYIL